MKLYVSTLLVCILVGMPARAQAEAAAPAAGGAVVAEVQVEDVFLAVAGATHGFTDAEEWTLAEAVVEAARLEGVDPWLVLAVIKVESSLKKGQRSHAGALGLMQVRPPTGRAFAERAGVPWSGSATLLDPTSNIRIGTAYLAHLLRRFGGDVTVALTGYCHGPTRVRRLLRAGGLDDGRLRYSRKVLRTWERLRSSSAPSTPVS